MTTTRRCKAPTRSVARRRAKPRKSQLAKRTHKRRKSRNIVMRGGADDVSLYGDGSIDQPTKCIIIKKKKVGFRDDLYLFFVKDITLEEITKFVRDAMGLDDSVSFTPEFVLRTASDPTHKLNDLFIKLSGAMSYSNISSGYLQREKTSADKAVDTSTNHKITSQSSPKITNWKDVLKKLGFIEYFFRYIKLTNSTAEEGYSSITFDKKDIQQRQQSSRETQCRMKITDVIGINRSKNIREMKKKIGKWPEFIQKMALAKKSVIGINGKPITKEENSKAIQKHLDEFQPDYDSNVRELRKSIGNIQEYDPDYKALSDECKSLFESEYSEYNTIDEIVSKVYGSESLAVDDDTP